MAVDIHASTVSRLITTAPTVPWHPHSRWVEGPSKSDWGGCHQWLQHMSSTGPQLARVRPEAGATSHTAPPMGLHNTRLNAPILVQGGRGRWDGAMKEPHHWQDGPAFMKGAATIMVANSTTCAFGVVGTTA